MIGGCRWPGSTSYDSGSKEMGWQGLTSRSSGTSISSLKNSWGASAPKLEILAVQWLCLKVYLDIGGIRIYKQRQTCLAHHLH